MTTDNDAPDWEALARFRAGEGSPADAASVAAWLAAHPGDRRLLEELDASIARELSVQPSTAPVDVEAALARLHARIDRTDRADGERRVPTLRVARGFGAASGRRHPMRWLGGGLAAAAAVVAIAYGVRTSEPDARMATPSAATLQPGHDLQTAAGAVDSVRLPDGTRVVLGPATRLRLEDAFGGASRRVSLDGVARFTVTHDAARPFEVVGGNGLVRDVGTTFVVRTPIAKGPGLSVAVLDGAVELTSAPSGAPTTLRAGERGALGPDGHFVALPGGAGANDDAWARGALDYHAAPLDVVRDDVRRWYGVEVRLADSALATRRLTGTFERATADVVLQRIALALGLTVDRAGPVATLRATAIAP